MSRLTRRAFLALAITAPWLSRTSWASEQQLSAFLMLSKEATGFQALDVGLARTYMLALLAWEPRLPSLLSKTSLAGLSKAELAVVDQVIEAWYTGTVPSARGTEVVTYEGALGWACLPRSTPVTFCRE